MEDHISDQVHLGCDHAATRSIIIFPMMQQLSLLEIFTVIIEEDSAKRGSSPQIMKIELVSISATESSFLHPRFIVM